MKERLEYFKFKDLRDGYGSMINRIANIRMIMFIVMIISFILKYYYYPFFLNVVFFVSFAIFVILVLIYDKYFKIYDFYDKYVKVLDSYVSRDDGTWKSFQDKGIDFLNDSDAYLSDLDILGDCSLFQYLSVCKTLGGRKRLLNKLSNMETSKEDLVNNQSLIKELVNDVDFNIKFQVLISFYENKEIDLTKQLNSFQSCDNNVKDSIIAGITSIICIGLLILGFFKIIPMGYFYGVFLFNVAISFLYVYIYKEEFSNLDKLVNYYAKLVPIFELVSNYKANSTKMKKIVKEMNNGLRESVKLKELDAINSLRNNILSNFLLNGLCCLNLFVRTRYNFFLINSFNKLKLSIFNVEELEAMISLATIGIVKNKKCMPNLSERIELGFNELRHPLIDERDCVSNSFNTKSGVNIITGSNMGGKTTFLRTIGINLILMQAGTYVCADRFEASYFKIFTSMRVMDNIDKGISTFYGELLRIKDMVEYVNKGNMLVLVDEIFKGTNYNDRMYGAKEVVKKLNNKSTIAFITTHDFELCESSGVHNYHVKEDYEGDKIVFDYKIRDGKCSSTNARYLMKKLDIVN